MSRASLLILISLLFASCSSDLEKALKKNKIAFKISSGLRSEIKVDEECQLKGVLSEAHGEIHICLKKFEDSAQVSKWIQEKQAQLLKFYQVPYYQPGYPGYEQCPQDVIPKRREDFRNPVVVLDYYSDYGNQARVCQKEDAVFKSLQKFFVCPGMQVLQVQSHIRHQHKAPGLVESMESFGCQDRDYYHHFIEIQKLVQDRNQELLQVNRHLFGQQGDVLFKFDWIAPRPLPNGDYLTMIARDKPAWPLNHYYPARFRQNGEIVWERKDMYVNRKSFKRRGNILMISYKDKKYNGMPVSIEVIKEVDASTGKILDRWHIWELAPQLKRLAPQKMKRRPRQFDNLTGLDFIHTTPDENWLISFKNLDLVISYDPQKKKILWHLGAPFLRRPQSARMLKNGNLVLLDQNGKTKEKRFRLMEINPKTKKIIWSHFPKIEIHRQRPESGTITKLENGNYLYSLKINGTAEEITPEGKVIWRAINHRRHSSMYFGSIKIIDKIPADYFKR